MKSPQPCLLWPNHCVGMELDCRDQKSSGRLGSSVHSRAVLEYCAQDRPTLICIDDCQWLDRPSLRVLGEFAARQPENVLLLIGSRPNEGMSRELLETLEGGHRLEFGELDESGIYALSESMAGPLPIKIKAAVVAMSEGSPFLANAAMRGLVESRALVPAAKGWRIDEDKFSDFQAAGDSASVLLKRLQFLDADAAHLLSIGAVIGKNFDIQIPLALTGVDAQRSICEIEARTRSGIDLE